MRENGVIALVPRAFVFVRLLNYDVFVLGHVSFPLPGRPALLAGAGLRSPLLGLALPLVGLLRVRYVQGTLCQDAFVYSEALSPRLHWTGLLLRCWLGLVLFLLILFFHYMNNFIIS